MNLWDLLILLAIAAVAVFSLISSRRRKAAGKSACGCCSTGDCAGCPSSILPGASKDCCRGAESGRREP